jgi:plastocyanin
MANPHTKKSNAPWIAAAVVVSVIIVLASVFAYQLTQTGTTTNSSPTPSGSPSGTPVPSTGNVTIEVYAGELTLGSYGFGNSSSTITSPGPSFTVKAGTTVTIHFTNSGKMAHNWALVTEKVSGSNLLAFSKSQVASGANPVQAGGQGSTTFVADKAGNYYYICQVDSHVTLGMWGTFTVTP